jgi:hypothetical protein
LLVVAHGVVLDRWPEGGKPRFVSRRHGARPPEP